MPELPEVETVCRSLAPIFEGKRLTKVLLKRADLRFPFPKNFCQLLTGKCVKKVVRRAKYILVTLTDGTILICHLGMSGSFRFYADNSPSIHTHDHVIFSIGEDKEIRYNDPRRFGFMTVTNENEIKDHPLLKNLGPEPIDPSLDSSVLSALLKNRKGSIKNVLLNQSVIAGIGNIYASEALHLAGISPFRKANNVKGIRAQRLAQAIDEVLCAAIACGGASLQDHKTPFGDLGLFQNEFRVYGRNGSNCKKCLDGSMIQKIVQASRSTFFCSNCQR